MSFRPTSLMFVFSYLYFCTYVLSPIIMLSDKNIVGVHNKPSEYYLYFAMMLSILVYMIIFFGYIKAKDCNRGWNLKIVLNLKIFYLVALCSMLFFIYFHWDSILARLFYHKPIDVFKVSNGSGVFILISSIYKYCFIFFIAYVFIKIKNNL